MGRPIPELFYSFETQKPFDHCIECSRRLEENTQYVIEKAIRSYEGYGAKDVIFDYAICMDCAMELRSSFSKESRQKMDEYFMQNLSGVVGPGHPEDDYLNSCLIKGIPIERLREYQVYAHCKGGFLSEEVSPYLISSHAQEEVMNLISNATNDLLNGFFDKHFSPDPELVQPRPVLI